VSFCLRVQRHDGGVRSGPGRLSRARARGCLRAVRLAREGAALLRGRHAERLRLRIDVGAEVYQGLAAGGPIARDPQRGARATHARARCARVCIICMHMPLWYSVR